MIDSHFGFASSRTHKGCAFLYFTFHKKRWDASQAHYCQNYVYIYLDLDWNKYLCWLISTAYNIQRIANWYDSSFHRYIRVILFFPLEFSSCIRTIFVPSFVHHIHFHIAIGPLKYENVSKSDAYSKLPAATKEKKKNRMCWRRKKKCLN